MDSSIVFFGDSITASNRSEWMPLGDGYVSILADLFKSDKRLNHFKLINSGINGHTITDLLNRYVQDVIRHRPKGVVIKIGINDAYLDFHESSQGSDIHTYQEGLHRLVASIKEKLPHTKLILFTPYLIVDSQADEFYQKMTAYGKVMKSLGSQHGLPVLDIQAVFDMAVKSIPAEAWADDQIHPHHEGHDLIARAAFTFLQGHLP